MTRIIIYIDFDDTLYIHGKHWKYEDDFEVGMLFGTGELKYSPDNLNIGLLNKLKACREELKRQNYDSSVAMLSGCNNSLYFEAKKKFLSTVCPDVFDFYFGVTSQSDKLKFIKSFNDWYSDTHHEPVKAMIIDDDFKVLSDCSANGIVCYSPLYFEKIAELN